MSLEIAARFALQGRPLSCERYGNGHINETYLVPCEGGRRYILQKINRHVFRDVPGLMRNIAGVTRYLAKQDPDPRHTLTLVESLNGEDWIEDEAGGAWRMYDFIEDSLCLEQASTPEDFYQSAVAFGEFQRRLDAYPANTLCEVIPRFHDTPDRYRQLHAAIDENRAGRLDRVQPELEYALSQEASASALVDWLADGTIPLRVTHNDTKLNNVMLDAQTRTPLCVIDLDTVMPGAMACDFGDSIRFGASTAAEDETDLSRVRLSMELYRAYAEGFLGACGASATGAERASLPIGARLMTLECGIRFLADYLNGDVYFHTSRPEHNLDRCRTQFKLVREMDAHMEEMTDIVRA